MSISIQKKKLLVVALACAAVTLTMIASWQLLKEMEYYDEEEEEDEDEDEEEDEFTSEDTHCEDLEDGVEVTSSRRMRSNLALEGGDTSGCDIIVKVIEGSSHQKRDGCTSGSESNCAVRKKPRTGDLVKERC